MAGPSTSASGFYEIVWMDEGDTPRRRRFLCRSASERDVYRAGRRLAEHSRHGASYVITVRRTEPDW
jgi:hypothetical protein